MPGPPALDPDDGEYVRCGDDDPGDHQQGAGREQTGARDQLLVTGLFPEPLVYLCEAGHAAYFGIRTLYSTSDVRVTVGRANGRRSRISGE